MKIHTKNRFKRGKKRNEKKECYVLYPFLKPLAIYIPLHMFFLFALNAINGTSLHKKIHLI